MHYAILLLVAVATFGAILAVRPRRAAQDSLGYQVALLVVSSILAAVVWFSWTRPVLAPDQPEHFEGGLVVLASRQHDGREWSAADIHDTTVAVLERNDVPAAKAAEWVPLAAASDEALCIGVDEAENGRMTVGVEPADVLNGCNPFPAVNTEVASRLGTDAACPDSLCESRFLREYADERAERGAVLRYSIVFWGDMVPKSTSGACGRTLRSDVDNVAPGAWTKVATSPDATRLAVYSGELGTTEFAPSLIDLCPQRSLSTRVGDKREVNGPSIGPVDVPGVASAATGRAQMEIAEAAGLDAIDPGSGAYRSGGDTPANLGVSISLASAQRKPLEEQTGVSPGPPIWSETSSTWYAAMEWGASLEAPTVTYVDPRTTAAMQQRVFLAGLAFGAILSLTAVAIEGLLRRAYAARSAS